MNKKYNDNERPKGCCYDCSLPYGSFPCDMIIQPVLWELINPTYHKGAGLLCPNCMCARIMNLNLGVTVLNVTVDLSELLENR